MVAVIAVFAAGGTRVVSWPNYRLSRHYVNGRLHREGGPAVDVKGTFEAWYQHGDPHRIACTPLSCDSNTAYMAMRTIHKDTQQWLVAGALVVFDAFVFAARLIDLNDAEKYLAWTCGDTRTSYADCCTKFVGELYVCQVRIKTKDPTADTLICSNVTELSLACLASKQPVRNTVTEWCSWHHSGEIWCHRGTTQEKSGAIVELPSQLGSSMSRTLEA